MPVWVCMLTSLSASVQYLMHPQSSCTFSHLMQSCKKKKERPCVAEVFIIPNFTTEETETKTQGGEVP